MDRVRFGRALGYGARHAAKTLMSAAEAASAPSPSGPSPSGAASSDSPGPAQPVAGPATEPKCAAARPQPVQPRLEPNARIGAGARAGRSIFDPVKHFSSTVLQQVAGTMFALFAFVIGSAVWKLRGALAGPQNSPQMHRLYFAGIMFALFAYFAISSFSRASRAGRR